MRKKNSTHYLLLICVFAFITLGCADTSDDSNTPDSDPSNYNAIEAFCFLATHNTDLSVDVDGLIAGVGKTVDLTVPSGTDVNALVPTISIIGSSISPDNNATTDYTNPVIYTVTAEDATTQEYTVTVSSVDTTAPTIMSVSPTDGTSDVFLDTSIQVTFSEAIDSSTLTTDSFTLNDGSSDIAGTISTSGSIAILTPSYPLQSNTEFTATLMTTIEDNNDNSLAENYFWSFTTGETAEIFSVISTYPTDQSTNVSSRATIAATFSREIDPDTNPESLLVFTGGSRVSGTVNFSGQTASFDPDEDFEINTLYTGYVTTDIKDLSGDSLNQNYHWNFVTSVYTSPIANAGDNQYVNTGSVSLDGSGSSGPYSLPLSYQWSLISGPSGSQAHLSDSSAVNPTFTTDVSGEYGISLEVNNVLGTTDSDNVTITAVSPTEIYIDPTTGFLWQDDSYMEMHDSQAAIDYCNTLELDGISGWQLPSLSDFQHLYDQHTQNNILNGWITSLGYRTSDASGPGLETAFRYDGQAMYMIEWNERFYVRCVRVGQ